MLVGMGKAEDRSSPGKFPNVDRLGEPGRTVAGEGGESDTGLVTGSGVEDVTAAFAFAATMGTGVSDDMRVAYPGMST